MSPREGDLAAAAIAAYAPASLSPEAAAFARSAAARAAPGRRERAKALLYAAGRLAAFGESVGMELRAEALLAEASVERFVLTGCPALSAATRRPCAPTCGRWPAPIGALRGPSRPRCRASAPRRPMGRRRSRATCGRLGRRAPRRGGCAPRR